MSTASSPSGAAAAAAAAAEEKSVVRRTAAAAAVAAAIVDTILPSAPLWEVDEYMQFLLLEIPHDPIYKMVKLQIDSHWSHSEIDPSGDLACWRSLPEEERRYLELIMAFFLLSDGIVMRNLADRFLDEVVHPMVRAFYTGQANMEMIHSFTYSRLLRAYVPQADRFHELARAAKEIPTIKAKTDWALKWIGREASQETFPVRLVAFAIVEGLFFAGSFAAIFWQKQKGNLHALTQSNELISRDEGLHTRFAILLLHMFYPKGSVERPPQAKVHSMVSEAVAIEKAFHTEALPVRLIGMNAEHMCTYVEFVADQLLLMMGYERLPREGPPPENPFHFMNNIFLTGHTNFFERQVSEYRKSQVAYSGGGGDASAATVAAAEVYSSSVLTF